MQQKIIELKKKYDKVCSGRPWYGDSIMQVLRKTDPEIVFRKLNDKSHSIAELLAHIIGWREISLHNLKGNKRIALTQKETFNWKRFDKNEKTAWKRLLKELDKNQREIISFLEKKDDEFLANLVPGKKFKMEFLINGIIQHDIYHLGQIGLLKKALYGR